MSLLDGMLAWWQGGDWLMWALLGTALVLYTLIGERFWRLFGPGSRRGHRRDAIERMMDEHVEGAGAEARREWLARYVGLAEAIEMTRSLALIRALTATLPLLGLLGTVLGMVDTFGAIAAARDAAAIARDSGHGIGLALTATQYGIALAVPALVCEWVLRRRVEVLVLDREQAVRGAIAGSPA